MVRSILVIITVLTILIIQFSCVEGDHIMSKYEWLPTESAEKQFPMQIVKGDFYFKNGDSIYIPDGRVIENGWGKVGSTHLVGEDSKPLPYKLAIKWFSYIENKFYSGEFNLPYDDIKHFFEEGFESHVDGKQTPYKYIIVGLGLNGEIFIWLAGGSVVLEVALFQAKEATMDWTLIVDNPKISRNQFIDLILADSLSPDQILQAKNQAGRNDPWERYKVKYRWGLDIVGTPELQSLWLTNFNGEKEYLNYSRGISDKNILRSVPVKIDIDWRSSSGNAYNANIIFNEEEMFKAFNKLYASDPNDPLQLQIEIDDLLNKVKTKIINSKYTLGIKEAKIEVSRYAD